MHGHLALPRKVPQERRAKFVPINVIRFVDSFVAGTAASIPEVIEGKPSSKQPRCTTLIVYRFLQSGRSSPAHRLVLSLLVPLLLQGLDFSISTLTCFAMNSGHQWPLLPRRRRRIAVVIGRRIRNQ